MPILYRKRLIPYETVLLKNDEILYRDRNVLVTKWKTLHPRDDFASGFSCYFIDRGYKISKFLDKNGKLVYYYCDIITTQYEKNTDTYTFLDLLVDVIIYPDGKVNVVDIGELSQALEENLITREELKKALESLDGLLKLVYGGNLLETVSPYFE